MVSLRPSLAEPSDHAAGLIVVGNDVGVRVGEETSGFCSGVGGDCKLCACREVGILVSAKRFSVVADIPATMEG